ncbi:MAG TPA: TetR family transcriptional regulator [Pilimelia sp.]|nr:TetR family transcriptional regulator [Pilimelia sp.]
MSARQHDIVDAAISVLGRHGSRRLTHRAVDAEAGLPTGSTSNYFRNRDALIAALVDRFAAREQAAWQAIAARASPATADELATALARFAVEATGPNRVVTVARYAIFVEAALRPDLQRQLAATADRIRDWGAQWLHAVGSTDPRRDAQIVLNQLDGLLLHQLAFPDPGFDPAGPLAATINGLIDK